MKKRIYALALCLLLLAAFPLTAFADGEGAQTAPELTIATEREDETLTVTVGVVNNPGIAGVDLALHFNSAALTPSAAPQMATGWEYTVTNYEGSFSRDTLKVVSARKESFTGDGTLFTASFTVKDSGSYALSVDGVAGTEGEELIELLPAYVDDFGVKTAAWEGDRLTVTLVSCGGAFHGSGKAMLACYDGAKFVGCKVANFTVGENAAADVMFDVAALSGGAAPTLRLMLLTPQFVPLTASVVLPAGK